MYYTPLINNSPKYSRYRTQILKSNQQLLYHFSVKQIQRFQQFYDDIKYNSKIITKFITIAKIIQFSKALSPRGMTIVKIKISNGQFNLVKPLIAYYDGQLQEKLNYAIKHKSYIKIGAQVKVTGLPHKSQIQIRCISFALIQDFNQITSHSYECIKSHLETV